MNGWVRPATAALALVLTGCASLSDGGAAPAVARSVEASTEVSTEAAPTTTSRGTAVSTSPVASATSAARSSTPPPAKAGKVSDLVGRWAVHASGEPTTTRLVLDAHQGLSIFHACGVLSGSWRAAADGAFITSMSGGSGTCFASTASPFTALPWLWKATTFRSSAGSVALLDVHGRVLARLTPGDLPKVTKDDSISLAEVLPLTAADRARLDPVPVALPAGLVPATAAALAGTWVPTDGTRGYVTMALTGSYRSDGCHGQNGSWHVDLQGGLIVTAGPTTLVLCSGTQVPDKLASASAAGFEGPVLDLVDATGHVSLTLHRGPAPATP
ncbi:MAG: hypothetical protein QOE24_3223 [Frankiales bacterium]|nr:hypothetical protein [Frankiales bacterium]